jgi:NAD(P)-dependent dehydrogenase (short-subunit alcohol dehydrogenase family)
MLLQDKTALVFAATGAIGSAVAAQFARHGARVYVSGRDPTALERLGQELDAAWELVDATDEAKVSEYIDRIASQTGGVDVVFNAIGLRAADAQYATPATQLELEKFLLPLRVIVGSQFLTARAAARRMAPKGRGAIVTLSASLSGKFVPFMSGIAAACGAIEAMTRTMAAEFGPAGVRVNCVRAGGMPETRTIRETIANMAATTGKTPQVAERPTSDNVLARPLRVEETAAAVAFVASDAASGIAGQVINVCAGAIVS